MENNTNFQTFHQMGQAINDFVKQATGRDNVQNIDMDHITVAQNHFYQDVDVSGRVVSFHAGAAGLPLEKCVVQIEPVQDLHGYDYPWPAGGGKNKWPLGDITEAQTGIPVSFPAGTYFMSGVGTNNANIRFYYADETSTLVTSAVGKSFVLTADCVSINMALTGTGDITNVQLEEGTTPTAYEPYSNICPIIGWTGAQVFISPTTDAADGQTYSIAFPSEAGTVYGGTLDAVSGELVVDMKKKTYDGSENWAGYTYFEGYLLYEPEIKRGIRQNGFSNMLKDSKSAEAGQKNCMWLGVNTQYIYVIGVYETMGSTLADFKNYLANHNLEVVYPLATPITYQLTPQEVTTLLGTNNIWADTGDIEVKFKDLKELY